MAREILLLRSARHLFTAVRVLRTRFPESRITVASQTGTDELLDLLDIPADQRVLGPWRQFTPTALLRTAVGRALRRRRFDEVAVLWLDPDGRGYGNVNRAALLLAPGGFLAITPTGDLIRQTPRRVLTAEARVAARSMAAAILIGALLVVPARLMRLVGL